MCDNNYLVLAKQASRAPYTHLNYFSIFRFVQKSSNRVSERLVSMRLTRKANFVLEFNTHHTRHWRLSAEMLKACRFELKQLVLLAAFFV